MGRYLTYTVTPDEEGIRLDRWIKRQLPHLSQGLLQKSLRKGDVRVAMQKVQASFLLKAGETISVYELLTQVSEAFLEKEHRNIKKHPLWNPQDWLFLEQAVLYQDTDVLVLNKPSGLATQGGVKLSKHLIGLLEAWFEAAQPGLKPYLVHRLDKETSGVLLVALNPFTAAFLGKAFREQRVNKTYQAVVLGDFPALEGSLTFFIQKRPGRAGEKMEIVSEEAEEGLYSQTDYRVVEKGRGVDGTCWSFVELYPLTGRTHQLRIHCMAVAGPILGDGKYGGGAAFLGEKDPLHLHARKLTFPHPRGGVRTLEAELPFYFQETLENLRGGSVDDKQI